MRPYGHQQSGKGRYDKIVAMIEESEQLKSTAENHAAHLADRLVPYTLAGSVLVYLLTRNVTRALSVLMVDFSCALKLSMPPGGSLRHERDQPLPCDRERWKVPGSCGPGGYHCF